jgi:acetyltransferase-like isoleucine patch superfamily enzyme
MKRHYNYRIAYLISHLPFNWLRCILYNRLCGYSIQDSKIGRGTLLAISSATIHRATIGHSNQFTGPITLVIKPGAWIGNHNQFICGEWTDQDDQNNQPYARTLVLAENAMIADSHFFDISGKLEIGKGTWIAGRDSQFWTHGAGILDRNIQIGQQCYIGSAARFAPGSSLGDNVLLSLGSVVTNKLTTSNAMIGGVPARLLKENYDWRSQQFISPLRLAS